MIEFNFGKYSFSGILLAGGKSSRMKTQKALLRLGGMTLLERQIEKLKALGCDEIILSLAAEGAENFKVAEESQVLQVRDLVAEAGPLAGLYSCLPRCRFPALVISVDLPLLSVETLRGLLQAHLEAGNRDSGRLISRGKMPKATILRSHGVMEPLIGVYDPACGEICKNLIEGRGFETEKKPAVRALIQRLNCQFYEFTGDPRELLNCNSPEDFQQAKEFFSKA